MNCKHCGREIAAEQAIQAPAEITTPMDSWAQRTIELERQIDAIVVTAEAHRTSDPVKDET